MSVSSKISVVIVTYNAMKWAEKCFTSLQQSSLKVDVIVIDNGSNDGTQDYITKNFPEVDFIQSQENLGFGKANNIGIEKAYLNNADFIYLMNQDAWVYPNTFSDLIALYQSFSKPEEIGIISPLHLEGSEKNIEIYVEKYLSLNAVKDKIFSDLMVNRNETQAYYELDFINAAHWLLPKHTIEIVGGFNPYFFHYGEDNEYINRCHYHQLKIVIASKIFAVHDAIQKLDKVDYSKYRNTAIDTKLMNPNGNSSLSQEIKSYRKNLLKNVLSFNFAEAKKSQNEIAYLKKNRQTFEKIKQQVKKSQPSFLNLNKH